MKVIDLVNVDASSKTVMAVIEDYFRIYSEDPEVPETGPKLCLANYSKDPYEKNLQWNLIEADYDV